MNRKELLLRVQTLALATNLFGESSVVIGSGANEPLLRDPSCLILVDSDEPYGNHGQTLSVLQVRLRIRISSNTPQGYGHVLDAYGKDIGGIESILPALQNSLWFVDTNAAAAHSTWCRYIRTDGPSPLDKTTGEYNMRLEALVTRT